MKFISFEFKNFKGMRSTVLNLTARDSDARVTTLVGLNESGKTTVLEGIDRFVPGSSESEEIGPKHIGEWRPAEPYELIPISKRSNFNDTIEIVVRLALDESDKQDVTRDVLRNANFRLTKIPDEIVVSNVYTFKNSSYDRSITRWQSPLGEGRTKQGKKIYQVESRGQRHLVWLATVEALRLRVPTVWYFPNFLFDFPDGVDLTPDAGESSTNKLYRSLFADILRSVQKDLTPQVHVIDRALSSDPTATRSLKQLSLDIGREVTKSVVEAWNALFKSSELDGKRVFVEIEVDSREHVVVSFLLEDSDGIFAIRERSLGFRWFFVYLLLTTYRGRREGPSSNIVFLFDEPASNLHTSAQAILLNSLELLSRSAHIVYTTHSQHLINPAWLETTFVVSNEGFDTTRVTTQRAATTDIKVERYAAFANRNPTRSHYFQPVLDVLEYQPSKLELVPDVVMVEGKSDYYTIRYFQEVASTTAIGQRLNLLPGLGAGSLDLPIQMYSAWGRAFIVLLDSDTAGNVARRRYLTNFGEALGPLITSLNREVPGVTEIEDIFSVGERLLIERVVKPGANKPTKGGFLRGIEHAFATQTEVQLSEITRERLNGLCSALRARLQQSATNNVEA